MKSIPAIISCVFWLFASCSDGKFKSSGTSPRPQQRPVQKPANQEPKQRSANSSFGSGENFQSVPTCEIKDALLYKKKVLKFPLSSSSCDWGRNGNLPSMEGGRANARAEQIRDIGIPPRSKICGLKMTFLTESIKYDDHILMTLGDVVLFSSSSPMLQDLEKPEQGVLIYDWQKMVGRQMGRTQSLEIFCAGEGAEQASCTIPRSEASGQFAMDIPDGFVKRISKNYEGTHQLKFITTGDDNSTDCKHEPVEVEVDLIYISRH